VTPYARGRAFEYRVRDRLEAQGFIVFRTAGSRSPVDLIAFRDGCALFVQCKSGKRSLSRRERMALVDLAGACGGQAAVAERGGLLTVLEAA
jgi:Holliday junction resolvase